MELGSAICMRGDEGLLEAPMTSCQRTGANPVQQDGFFRLPTHISQRPQHPAQRTTSWVPRGKKALQFYTWPS